MHIFHLVLIFTAGCVEKRIKPKIQLPLERSAAKSSGIVDNNEKSVCSNIVPDNLICNNVETISSSISEFKDACLRNDFQCCYILSLIESYQVDLQPNVEDVEVTQNHIYFVIEGRMRLFNYIVESKYYKRAVKHGHILALANEAYITNDIDKWLTIKDEIFKQCEIGNYYGCLYYSLLNTERDISWLLNNCKKGDEPSCVIYSNYIKTVEESISDEVTAFLIKMCFDGMISICSEEEYINYLIKRKLNIECAQCMYSKLMVMYNITGLYSTIFNTAYCAKCYGGSRVNIEKLQKPKKYCIYKRNLLK